MGARPVCTRFGVGTASGDGEQAEKEGVEWVTVGG